MATISNMPTHTYSQAICGFIVSFDFLIDGRHDWPVEECDAWFDSAEVRIPGDHKVLYRFNDFALLKATLERLDDGTGEDEDPCLGEFPGEDELAEGAVRDWMEGDA